MDTSRMKQLIGFTLLLVATQASLVERSIEIPTRLLPSRHSAVDNQDVDFLPGYLTQHGGAEDLGDAQDKIVGGTEAIPGQFPWQVSITMEGSFFCGGSIISDTWVLTAGHCVEGITSFLLVVGSLNKDGGDSGSVSTTSRTSVLHAAYSSTSIANDIGLIQLPSPLAWTSVISAVRLPRQNQVAQTFTGELARVAGWGRTSDADSTPSPVLMWIEVPVISNTMCANTFGVFVRASNICTSGLGGKNTCTGDSGGGLVWQDTDGLWTEIGISSYGSSNGCQAGSPVAYTRVTSYLDWISVNTGIVIT